MTQTKTITLSEPTALKLHRAVEVTHQSADEIIGRALDAVLFSLPDLSPEGAQVVALLQALNDRELRKAVRPIMTQREHRRLQTLNRLAGRRELSTVEAEEQRTLLRRYQWSALRRAAALAVLAQRGIHIPIVKEKPRPTSDAQSNPRLAS